MRLERWDVPQREREDDDDEWDVDEEDRAPPEIFEEEASEKGTDRGASGGDRGPDPYRETSLVRIVKGNPEEGERGGHHRGGTDREADAASNQHRRRRRICSEERSGTEDRETDEEDPPRSDAITEGTHTGEKRSGDEGIGVEDPELLGGRCRERDREPRKRRIEHRQVDDDQKKRGGDEAEDDPPMRPELLIHPDSMYALSGIRAQGMHAQGKFVEASTSGAWPWLAIGPTGRPRDLRPDARAASRIE